jgi:hypothetical protein
VVVVEVLVPTRNVTTNVNLTRYHLDLQDCASPSSSTKNTSDNTTVCTTTLLFPWESYYNNYLNPNNNTNSNSSSGVHRSQLHLLLLLQGEESFSSAIILDEAHSLEPKHNNDLLLPIQLTASHISNGDNNEIFPTRQTLDMDITAQYDTVGNCFPAHNRITTPNIAIVLFLLLLPLLPLLLIPSNAYEPSNVSFAQLLLQTAYHCFYPAPYHDAYYYHFDSDTTHTSQNATNIDPTPVSYVPQDRRGTNANVCISQKQQPPSGGHSTNKVDSVPYLPTSTAINAISTSPSFITSPPIVIRQSFYDAPTENKIMKVSLTSSKKHIGTTTSTMALSTLPTHLRKRKKNAIIPKPNGTKIITTSTTHHTNDRYNNNNNNNKDHYLGSLGRKRLKLFNPTNDKKELWTLHDDSSCNNTFAFM